MKVWLTIVVWLLRKWLTYVGVASPGVMHHWLTDSRLVRPHQGGHVKGSGCKHRGQDMMQQMDTGLCNDGRGFGVLFFFFFNATLGSQTQI